MSSRGLWILFVMSMFPGQIPNRDYTLYGGKIRFDWRGKTDLAHTQSGFRPGSATGFTRYLFAWEDDSRVENIVRIELAFDGSHQVEGDRVDFPWYELPLDHADAVFAGECSI